MFKTKNPWVICLVASSYFFYQYVQIIMFNVLQPDLILKFHTDAATISFVASLYFYGTVLVLIPAGIILDQFSTTKILVSTMALSVVGLIIFFGTDSIIIAAIGRFISGVSGGAFSFIGIIRLCNRWFPENRMAFITGLVVAIGMLGSIVALTPFAMLTDQVGLDHALEINIAVGIIITLIMFVFLHDYPEKKKDEYLHQIAYNKKQGYRSAIKYAISQPQNWFAGLTASLLNVPMLILGALWGMSYLIQIFNLTKIQASITCSAMFVGMIVGAPLFGVISDKLRLRKLPIFIGLIICFIATITLLMVPHLSYYDLIIIFCLIGFGLSSQCIAYPLVTEVNPIALSGSSLGVVSTLVMAGGAISQPLVGYLIEFWWDGKNLAGIPQYSKLNYNLGLGVLPICIMLSAASLFMLRETYCRRKN